MATPPPAAAGAPVLDQVVEPGAAASPRARFALPPALAGKVAGLLAAKKRLALVAGGTLALAVAAAAAWAFWPAPPQPRPAVAKSKKAKRPPAAASAASAVRVAAGASSAASEVAQAASEVAQAASEVAQAASQPAIAPAASAPASGEPEAPMDRLQRRLADVLGANGSLEAGGGELKLTARRPAPAASAVRRTATAGTALARPGIDRPAARPRASDAAIAWAYDGPAGPEAWGRLHPDFARCASGTRQSPIDLRDGFRVDLEPLRFDYRPSAFSVTDNGRTVQVDMAGGNAVELMGRRFELQRFVFHRPSEVRIAGRQFDMDVHLVHRDAEGRVAVVAVPLERGDAQPAVQSVWNNLPLEQGEAQAASSTLDPQQLLPAERGYFAYMGSLTTPPCTEGVLWVVMKQPVAASPEQIALFARLYPMNARPVQPAAGRMVKESH